MRILHPTMNAVIGEKRMGYGLLAARQGLLSVILPLIFAVLFTCPAAAQSDTPQANNPGASDPGASDPRADLASGDYFIGASVFLFERGIMAAFAPDNSNADELDRGAIYFAVVNSEGESGSLALDTIHGWLIAWAGGDGDPPGFSADRRSHLACLIVGADPKPAEDLAEAVGLGEEVRLKCAAEYEQAATRWSALVDPYRRAPDRQPPKNAGALALDYAPAVEPANDFIARAMQRNQLFDALTDEVNNALAMPRKTRVLLTECKKPQSFYNPDRREIVICYELLAGILAAAGK